MSGPTRVDPGDIARLRREADLPALIGRFTKLRRAGQGFVALCPFHDERNPSFSVFRASDGCWRFHCHGCGAAGDAIEWLMGREGLPFRQALGVLAGGELPDGGHHRPQDPKAVEKAAKAAAEDEARERDRAAELWLATGTAAGTAVETYLREARGLKRLGAIPKVIRCGMVSLWDTSRHKPREAWRGPAMVAKIDAPDPGRGAGRFHGIGVHLTFLEPDGSGKLDTKARGLVDFDGRPLAVKKMRGGHKGGAVRLCDLGIERIANGEIANSKDAGSDDSNRYSLLATRSILAVGEGIETSLSITDATGMPTWAAASLENLAGAAPAGIEGAAHPEKPGRLLPPTIPDLSDPAFPWDAVAAAGIDQAILLGDGDTKDLLALEAKLRRAANRAAAFGVTTRIATSRPGFDFNDLLRLRRGEGEARPGQDQSTTRETTDA